MNLIDSNKVINGKRRGWIGPLAALALVTGSGIAAAQPSITVSHGVPTSDGTVLLVPVNLRNSGSGTAQNLRITQVTGVTSPATFSGTLPVLLGALAEAATASKTLGFALHGLPQGSTLQFTVKGSFQDAAGRDYYYGSTRFVKVPPTNDQEEQQRQAVWRDFREAIRRGDTAAALALTSQERRAKFAAFLGALSPADRADIDRILPSDLRLLEVYEDGDLARYDMVRLTAGSLESFEVRFLKEDGVWRLLSF